MEEAKRDISTKAKEWIEEYGEDFLFELVDTFLEDAPNRLAHLREAFNGGEMETVIREVHTLKTSSFSMGAVRLSTLAKQMEFAALNGEHRGLPQQIEGLEHEYMHVKTVLEELKKSQP